MLSLLTSRRLTAALFLTFLALFVTGLWLPQRPLLSDAAYRAASVRLPGTIAAATEWLQLDDVYGSSAMMVVYVLFTAQVLAFLGTRSLRVVREAVRPPMERPEDLPIRLQITGGPAEFAALKQALRSQRFRVSGDHEAGLTAVKSAFSPIASLIFHASFIVLLGGGWMVKAKQFHGEVALAEGQPFHGTAREYLGGAAPESHLPGIAFTPGRIRPVLGAAGRAIDVECRVQLADGSEPRAIAVNRPLRIGDVAVLLMNYDLAPEITVTHRPSGREVDAQCVRLTVWSPGNPRDEFNLRRPRARVTARFFPDASSPSMEMRDPVLELAVAPMRSGQAAVTGRLRPGDVLAVGDFELRLDGLRTWGVFSVSREPGLLLVVGFVMMVIGAAYRLLRPRRWVAARVCRSGDSPVLSVGGRAELFPEGFRVDLEELLARVRGEDRVPKSAAHRSEGCHGND